MCKSLAIVWKVAAVKSPRKFPCKQNNIPKQFDISNRFEFTSGLLSLFGKKYLNHIYFSDARP